MRTICLFLCTLFFCTLYSFTVFSQTYKGRVLDKEKQTPLSRVSIVHKKRLVALTDSLGYFDLSIPTSGKPIKVSLHLPGYITTEEELHTQKENLLFLSLISHNIDDVTVLGRRLKRGNNTFSYKPVQAKNIATLTGEIDVMRYMQILPGVSQGIEGGLGFFVRGGGNGNNRVELDGVPIIAPTHLFGIVSTFPSDIIEKSTFQMGGITVASGDLLSSLLQIESRIPSKNKYKGSFSISPFIVGGALEGYLIKDKLSYQIAGRYSLLRGEYLLYKKSSKLEGDYNPQVYDYYAKLHWSINNKNSLETSIYGSHDSFDLETAKSDNNEFENMYMGWENRSYRLQWTFDISQYLQARTIAYKTLFENSQLRKINTKERFASTIWMGGEKEETTFRQQFYYNKKSISALAGIDHAIHKVTPQLHSSTDAKFIKTEKGKTFNYNTTALYTEVQYDKPGAYKAKGGLRYNHYKLKDGVSFQNIEARLHTSLFLAQSIGIEATYDLNTQHHHVLDGLPVGWALNLIVPATKRFGPERSQQLYIGGFAGTRKLYFTIGGYYKSLSNLVSFKSMLNQFGSKNPSWEEDVKQGRGESFGIELWGEYKDDKISLSSAYTLSRTTRQYNEINQDKEFPFKFDRTHNLNIQAQYLLWKRTRSKHKINGAMYLTSGNRASIPIASYVGETLPFWEKGVRSIPNLEEYHATVRTEMTPKNSFTMPPYFRIDLGYNIEWQRKSYSHELGINIFNVLNRHNPYIIFKDRNQWKQLSIMPLIPSINWRIWW